MVISIQVNGEKQTVEVSEAVFLVLNETRRKQENLHHEQRRHWDGRAFDETLVATQTHRYATYMETPEETYFRKEKFKAIRQTLATCTPVQRERFLLHALDGMSFADIARRQGCSKYAVRDSVQAVRKKFQTFFKNRPHESPFSGY